MSISIHSANQLQGLIYDRNFCEAEWQVYQLFGEGEQFQAMSCYMDITKHCENNQHETQEQQSHAIIKIIDSYQEQTP